MQLRTQTSRKAITVIATLTATIAVAATIFAPASFGSNRHKAALWESDPIILAVPPTVTPGSTMECSVEFEETASPAPEPSDPDSLKVAADDTKHVTIYSDPPGVISYSGTVSGSSANISASVSASAAPGQVTVYVESDGSTPLSTTTTVVAN